ncbi:1,2-phenylacetyl-CoA epoxidase subunit PaaE [Falsarthrobacter nasiphocae]|uniref:Ring-1,2-phenylacetyl-CoA epoxidase subunit PaaE n=1 Tax=Falsarthrobacter nasiphocae TaxID=189863 RepID=A0AAE3YFV7_9MICC|nr:1,2-phenylacetyl-CoA epoxidase subunit PaaE [Falsarthrobacter nasiphocae]MDR6892410.1 ring-1,2-phenylacetyl-CoA epoxidase subunit PaaE [Falsarthrobacter nasiphocae]
MTDQAPSKRRSAFAELTVTDVRRLTADSVEVAFTVPPELREQYDYVPGQYVALRKDLEVGGETREYRRSYSLCAPPRTLPDGSGEIRVAIKRDLGGVFSTWANERLQAGDRIDIMNPAGAFVSRHQSTSLNHPEALAAEVRNEDVFVAVAAGSGITPIMAIVRTLLTENPNARIDLIYANRSAADVMFLEELADMKDAWPSRLAVHHVLSREQRISPLLSGRLDSEKIERLLGAVIRPEHVDEWFLCGPFELVQLVRDSLADRGVPEDRVRFELFTTGAAREVEGQRGRAVVESSGPSFEVGFTLDGLQGTVQSPVAARETILNAALRVRPDVPFACAGGVCGTCRAKVVEGSAEMDENYALEKDEIENGYILTCQSRPTSERILVDYDA